jgi:hypothetical protein
MSIIIYQCYMMHINLENIVEIIENIPSDDVRNMSLYKHANCINISANGFARNRN